MGAGGEVGDYEGSGGGTMEGVERRTEEDVSEKGVSRPEGFGQV